jgi:hypothetical protein
MGCCDFSRLQDIPIVVLSRPAVNLVMLGFLLGFVKEAQFFFKAIF